MPYQATVLPVLIASPSDVQEYRAIARDVMHEWNYIHSPTTNAVLMPVGWETHSSPELGSSAQELLNDRVLEDCDLLVGIFWTRLGTPTGNAASGTVEEIQRHVTAGKPAMVYFSTAPASPETVDAEQIAALKEFRSWCQSQGLIENFSNGLDFQGKFRRHLQISLQKSAYLKAFFGQPLRKEAVDIFPANPSLCSGLICPDTSIGGQSTLRGVLHDKATPKIRYQPQAGSRAYDQRTRAQRSAC